MYSTNKLTYLSKTLGMDRDSIESADLPEESLNSYFTRVSRNELLQNRLRNNFIVCAALFGVAAGALTDSDLLIGASIVTYVASRFAGHSLKEKQYAIKRELRNEVGDKAVAELVKQYPKPE